MNAHDKLNQASRKLKKAKERFEYVSSAYNRARYREAREEHGLAYKAWRESLKK